MRRTRTLALPTALLAVLALAGTGPGPAAAAPRATTLACGAVVTTSIRLAAGLDCPDGNGITVAADGVDINLNGHTLTGPGTDREDWEADVGVDVQAHGVTIRNGRLRSWGVAVRAGTIDGPEVPVASAALRGLRVDANRWGVVTHPGGAFTVERSGLTRNLVAGGATWGGTMQVSASTADGNGTGFLVFGSSAAEEGFVLRDSLVRRSPQAAVACFSPATTILIERSTLQRNDIGYDDFGCGHWTVRDSTFQWNRWHVAGDLFVPNYTIECTAFLPRSRPLDLEVRPCT